MFDDTDIHSADSSLYQNCAALGEWAALGFYEGTPLGHPRAWGLALRRLYEHMEIRIPETGLIAPSDPFPVSHTFHDGAWHAEGLILGLNHSNGLHVNPRMAAEKKRAHPMLAGFIDRLCADLEHRLDKQHGGYTHSNPDILRVVRSGFNSIEHELDQELAATRRESQPDSHPERSLLLCLKDYAVGVRAFHNRTHAALRHAAEAAVNVGDMQRGEELMRMAAAFGTSFLEPATTFHGGLMAVHFTWLLDACDSIGHVDCALGELLERDLSAGRIDQATVQALLGEWFNAFERLNGWNLQIGGRRPDGTDGCNILTREILRACAQTSLRRPNVAFRLTADTPEEFLDEALAAIGHGSGRPAIYNDDRYQEILRPIIPGLTPEDASELAFGGCTETMIGGLSNFGSLDGRINLAAALEHAVHDGASTVPDGATGLRTGAFASFGTYEDFVRAVEAQIHHQIDELVTRMNGVFTRRAIRGDPLPARTLFTRDCVARRRSFEAGGARYNGSVITFQGVANLLDGLTAIRTLVFENHAIGRDELVAALRADFSGFEAIRRQLLRAPAYGNGRTAEDAVSARVLETACADILRQPHARGGVWLPSCIVFVTYGQAGETVGATPDGRKAKTPLADSAGPMFGRDHNGPTAMLRSVAALPLSLMPGTPVVNLRFQKALFASPESRNAIARLIRGFFTMGGLQCQITVADSETLRAAQAEPEAHADLIVRIGGYSERFTALPRDLQDSVIARTEHTLA